jgi:hypothetical protein
MSFVYLLLTFYLYNIIPQNFGVRKHPLFCLKKPLRNTFLYALIFGHDENSHIDESKLSEFDALEDQDSKKERKDILNMTQKQYESYPLVVREIRKIYPGFAHFEPKVANKNVSFKVEKG